MRPDCVSCGCHSARAVAREPGTRSKIAVISNDDRVDPVGSCVGMKGSRVQAVTRELAGERVDIVPWSAEASLLIGRALSPAIVSSITLHRERGEATVVVNEDQLSKAIGKEGKNVRLAAKLTDWKIDLVSSREYAVRQRVTDEMSMKLGEMEGVTPEIQDLLEASGVLTIAQLADESVERLAELEGLDEETVQKLVATATVTRDELTKMIEKTVVEEIEREVAEERPLFDEDALDEETLVTDEAVEAAEPEAVPKDVLFADFPESNGEEKAEDDDEDKPKVDPFANTELDD